MKKLTLEKDLNEKIKKAFENKKNQKMPKPEVREIKEKYKNMPEVFEDLSQIENKAQEIKTSGEAGWY